MRAVAARRRDHGAAAVEFALVVPVLLALLLGIIDYGMWFSDTLNARQGAREGARQAVVDNLVSPGCTQSDLAQVACIAKQRVGANGGTTYAKVQLYKPDGTTVTTEWTRGNQLLVCVAIKESGVTGFTPLPQDGLIRSSVVMRVEEGTHTRSAYSDTLPGGATWSC